MGIAIEMTKAYLDSRSVKYQELEKGSVLRVGYGGLKNKGDVAVIVHFDEDDRSVALRSLEICTVPEQKKQEIYKVCSQVNAKARWVKFYVHSKNNTLTAADDAVIQPESCGEEVFELVVRMVRIVDDMYPEFMKVIWG